MKSLKKSTSSPILAQPIIDANTNNKQKKHYIQQLQNQVNKSRIAVENINHNRKIQNNLYKNIEELQKELHQCILQINHQSNKHTTLDELNIVLKGEMNKVQAVQRNQEEYETNNFQKKIKKVEYDIKQILQKYNEEIAKIKNLKEDANASRDERVVYSNLFNKIEKEIKHYQKVYKQTLIKNEVFLDKKRQNHEKKLNNQSQSLQFKEETSENVYKQESKRSQVSQSKSNGETLKSKEVKLVSQNKKSLKTGDIQPFLTSVKENHKRYNAERSPTDSVASKTKGSAFSINYQRLIDEKQSQIDQIILNSQCKNLEEVLSKYNNIFSQNDNISVEIESIDENIELLQYQIQKLQLQKRTSQIYQNGQLSEIININKHSRNNKHIVYQQVSEEEKNKNLVMALCKKFHLTLQNDELIINNELLREIDQKVESLGCVKFHEIKKKDSVMITFDQFNSSNGSNNNTNDKIVCDLLDKIERFNECQKIFDRNMLKTEYQKELNKIRKKGKKNN